jgi:hypothetical protein
MCGLREVTIRQGYRHQGSQPVSRQVGVRRREIVPLDEAVVALFADPGISIGKPGSVLGVLGLEQLPSADGAAVSFPPTLDQQKPLGILGKARVKGEPLAILLENRIPRLPEPTFPQEDRLVEFQRGGRNCLQLVASAMNFNGIQRRGRPPVVGDLAKWATRGESLQTVAQQIQASCF